MKTVDIVIPCYNEEEALPLYFKAVDPVLKTLTGYKFGFLLVNDGSKDNTLSVMEKLYQEREDVTIINESRNFGQNPALIAGISQSKADYTITMDVDLQDPVTLFPEIMKAFEEGNDIVNPHRAKRKDSFLKKKTAGAFYKVLNKAAGRTAYPENVNTYRAFSKRAREAILALPEKDRYVQNEIPFVGFKTKTIDFDRPERDAGESKYNAKKLFLHAFNLISTGTEMPLYQVMILGVIGLFFFGFITLAFLVLWILGMAGVSVFAIPAVLEGMKVGLIVNTVLFGSNLVLTGVGVGTVYEHNILINTRGRNTTIIESVRRPEDKKK